MKINFIIGSTKVDERNFAPDTVALNLCGQGYPEGQAAGLMPLKLASNITVTPRVTVYTNTTTNRKGFVSAVVKVSMPYNALKMSDDGSQVAGIDANRSGGELSLHQVIALPAAVVADLRGSNGEVSRKNAEAQVGVLARLLGALLGPRFLDAGAAQVGSEGQMIATTSVAVVSSATSPFPIAMENASSLVPTTGLPGYIGYAGFDATEYHPTRRLSEVLQRVCNKMAPIGCEGVEAPSRVITLN